MADQTATSEPANASESPKKAKGLPMAAKIAIGCAVAAIIFAFLASLVIGTIIKKAGKAIVEKSIEKNTGIKTDISSDNGTMTYTDTKNGTKVEVGSGKIPESFPKDFPVYPGTKVTSSMSGSGQDSQSGYWLTLSTGDSFEKVSDYYKSNLKANGWVISGTSENEANITFAVKKDALEGTVTVENDSQTKETVILIVLGTNSDTPAAGTEQ